MDSVAQKELESARHALEQQLLYNQESVLMNVNPHNIYTATLELAVSTDYQLRPNQTLQDPDPSETLLRGYQVLFSTGAVSQAMGIEDKYLQEMMAFELTPTARSLQVQVGCCDQETAERVVQVLSDNLEDIHEQVEKAVCDHELLVLGSGVSVRANLLIAEQQMKIIERTRVLEENLAVAEASAAGGSIVGSEGSWKKAVILAVLGVIVGAVLVACVVWLRHISTDRVYSRRVLCNRTGVKVLFCAPGTQKRKIDSWLRKLEGREEDPAQLDVIAADIANRCGGKQLLITGEAGDRERALLIEALKNAGVAVQDRGSILCNADCMKALPEFELVLLAEQCERSCYSRVSRAVVLMQDHGKQLLGCVLMDG